MSELLLSPELSIEIQLLLRFDLHNLQAGIKIHHDAEASMVSAAERLFTKGMITQFDGGYLTGRGLEAALAAVKLLHVLQPVMH